MTDMRKGGAGFNRVQGPNAEQMRDRLWPEEQYEDLEQALYDVVHVPAGKPLEQLRFFDHAPGSDVKLLRNGVPGEHRLTFGDTDHFTPGITGYHGYRIRGVVHRLRCHPWRAPSTRSWWATAAQGAAFELRLIDKTYLWLPLDALPLLEPFESPFARWHEIIERYDADGKLLERVERSGRESAGWHLEIPLILERHQNFMVAITFAPPQPTPNTAFDVELMLLGDKRRPMQ